jgi:hypothetical protein
MHSVISTFLLASYPCAEPLPIAPPRSEHGHTLPDHLPAPRVPHSGTLHTVWTWRSSLATHREVGLIVASQRTTWTPHARCAVGPRTDRSRVLPPLVAVREVGRSMWGVRLADIERAIYEGADSAAAKRHGEHVPTTRADWGSAQRVGNAPATRRLHGCART